MSLTRFGQTAVIGTAIGVVAVMVSAATPAFSADPGSLSEIVGTAFPSVAVDTGMFPDLYPDMPDRS